MFKVLEKYQEKGSFSFRPSDNLNNKCNAPQHSSGIYTIYKEEVKPENLNFIGISGRENSKGEIQHRTDGIGGRIIKGKQFGDIRSRSWPKIMREDAIITIHVRWFVTYGKHNQDYPRPIENKLLRILLAVNGTLPSWNKET